MVKFRAAYVVESAILVMVLLTAGCGLIGGSPDEEKLIQIAVGEDKAVLTDELLAFLQDDDVGIRRRAVLAVCRVGDTMAVGALAGALADPDTIVRARAALALGFIKHRPTKPQIYQSLTQEDNAYVIEHLLWSLGRLYAQEYGDSLLPFLQHAHPRVRGQAALTMNMITHRTAAAAVAELLDDPESLVREYALIALPRLDLTGLEEKILPLLDDPDPNIRGSAAIALGNTKDPKYYPLLEELLGDPQRAIRLAAVIALGAMRDTILLEGLYPFLQTEQDPTVLSQLVHAIGWHWQRSAAPHLMKLADYPDIGVRSKLPAAMMRCLRQEGFDALKGFIDDPAWPVRAAVPKEMEIFAQPSWGLSESAAEALKTLITDSIPAVRAAAVKSAMAFRGLVSEQALQALRDPDELVRYYAFNILPFAGGRVTFDSLVQWYRDEQDNPRPDLRMAILALTANLSPSVQIGPLQRQIFNLGITDPDRHVRQYAAAVWLKFREDHRQEVGAFETAINARTYHDFYREYPARPRARFITQRGEFIVELYADETPRSVHHFIELAQSGFYDGTPVGVNDNGRTIYLGDRRADGWGVCNESLRDEITLRRIERGSLVWWVNHRHDAHSQFGLCLLPQPLSDFIRTVFGKVVEGMDVAERLRPLDKIEKVEIIFPEMAAR